MELKNLRILEPIHLALLLGLIPCGLNRGMRLPRPCPLHIFFFFDEAVRSNARRSTRPDDESKQMRETVEMTPFNWATGKKRDNNLLEQIAMHNCQSWRVDLSRHAIMYDPSKVSVVRGS